MGVDVNPQAQLQSPEFIRRTGIRVLYPYEARSEFKASADREAFERLTAGKTLAAGQYFGDYAVIGPQTDTAPPGYEEVGTYMQGGSHGNAWGIRPKDSPPYVPTLKIAKRAKSPEPAPTPNPTPTPTPPADRVDASNPSLADALKDQSQARERPALQEVLDSALRVNDWSRAGQGGAAGADGSQAERSNPEKEGRRFAASDRWRQRVEEVSSRFA